MEQKEQATFYRFQVYTGTLDDTGKVRKEKSVGFATLKEGQDMYSVKLWTFPQEKYYLIPTKDDPTKILIMTREEKKAPSQNNRKYNWSIVGSGTVISQKGVAFLDFDLLPLSIFMSIYPDKPNSNNLQVA
jgi:hypothetical protein